MNILSASKKKFLMNSRNTRIYYYILDMIKCFCASCGTVFIMLFLQHDSNDLGKDNLMQAVGYMFGIYLVICIAIRLLKLADPNYMETVTKIPAEYARRKDTLDLKSESIVYNREIIAVHEAGHALMAHLRGVENYRIIMTDDASFVEIVCKIADDRRLEDIILIKYAGAVAEEILLGKFHSTSMAEKGGDFDTAARLIKAYITMTDKTVSKLLLDIELMPQMISLSKMMYQNAKEILEKNRKVLEVLSKELMKESGMSKEEVGEVINQVIT